jgi:hypothetical protein
MLRREVTELYEELVLGREPEHPANAARRAVRRSSRRKPS